MVHRKRSGINRFVSTLFIRVLKVLILTGIVLLVLYLRVNLTRGQRAATLEAPENPQPPPANPPDTLRLLTYNIAHGRGPALNAENHDGGNKAEKRERLIRIGHEIRSLGADLVLLQEVDFNSWWSNNTDQAAIISEAAGYEYIVRQRNIDSGLPGVRRIEFGNVLLSHLPVTKAEKLTLPPYSELEVLFAGNHDALLARVQLSASEEILVIGLHLDERSEKTRVQAAEEVIHFQRQNSQPIILLGDLNSTPPGMPDSETTVTGQNTVELLESFGEFQRRPLRGKATNQNFTFPTVAPRRCIDWIMPDRNWRIQEYRVVHGMQESDHLPVLSTIRRR